MNSYENITYEAADHVAQIILNRPARLNALNKASLQEINRAMDQAESDAEVRVIVVSGMGRAFSSGFDLKAQMEQRPEGAQVWREILDLDFDTTMRFWNSPKPTIAAVHGACLAGAFELAMACDITIASEDATFGEPELKFGAGIVTMLLPWMTSPKQAKRIILSADDRIPARDALAMGLVSRVVENGRHLEASASHGARNRSDGSKLGRRNEEGTESYLRNSRHADRVEGCARHRSRDRISRIPRQACIHGRCARARHARSDRMAGRPLCEEPGLTRHRRTDEADAILSRHAATSRRLVFV